MAPPENLLEVLRERTVVDCDTMDVEGEILLRLFS
jgi:transaldolase